MLPRASFSFFVQNQVPKTAGGSEKPIILKGNFLSKQPSQLKLEASSPCSTWHVSVLKPKSPNLIDAPKTTLMKVFPWVYNIDDGGSYLHASKRQLPMLKSKLLKLPRSEASENSLY